MKITVQQYARSLYESVIDKNEGEIKEFLKNFSALLLKNRQENKLSEILAEFSKVWDQAQGHLPAELISVRELDQATKKLISEYLKTKTAAERIDLKSKIDEKILGGFILRYGDKIIDGSVRANLNNLKNKISN